MLEREQIVLMMKVLTSRGYKNVPEFAEKEENFHTFKSLNYVGRLAKKYSIRLELLLLRVNVKQTLRFQFIEALEHKKHKSAK